MMIFEELLVDVDVDVPFDVEVDVAFDVEVDVPFDDEVVEAFDVEVGELAELLLPVPDWELVLEVEVTLEDDDESGDSETQRTWPTERSQLASREGL